MRSGRRFQKVVRRICASAGVVLVLVCMTMVPFRSRGPSAYQRMQSDAPLGQYDYSFELEDLQAHATASAGALSRQAMQGFGKGWSGNAQLFWKAPPPVGNDWPTLQVPFNLPTAGKYDIFMYYTKAPDYGDFRVFFDGTPAPNTGQIVKGYAKAVERLMYILDRRQLTAGHHQLKVRISTKHESSEGYFVGLDRLVLKRLDAPLKAKP